jgi:DNA-directed RNA polymerase alpha subunit
MKAMELIENDVNIGQFPSMSEMASMSNYELFEIANQNERFRKVMVDFIKGLRVKPIVPEFLVDGKFEIKSLGLNVRLQNVLLQNDFEYLSDLSVVRSKDLFLMKNFGKKSYMELLEIMELYGFQLADKIK